MKEKQTSIQLNFIMNSILIMSSFIFPLITYPYISRILLPSGVGEVSFATSVVSYFTMFAELGIPTYGIRACAKVRDNKSELSATVQEIFTINAVMAVLVYIIFFIALFTVPQLREEKPLMMIVSLTVVFNCIGMEWLYKGLEKYSYITVRSLIFKAIALCLMFIFIHEKEDYVIYGAISIFAASASNVLNFLNVRRIVKFSLHRKLNIRRHFKPILILFGMSCASIVYTNLDHVMLRFMKTDSDVGLYDAAVKVKLVLVSLVTSLGTVLLPRASYYIEHNQTDDFVRVSKKAINFVFIASLPLVVYFMMFSDNCIYLLSGGAFEGAILPMKIIMPTLFFIGLTNIMGIQMLLPLGKEKLVLFSEIIGAVIDLILNLILIPKLGAAGAAIGTLAAEAGVFVFQFFAIEKYAKGLYRGLNYFKFIFATAAAAVSVFWIHNLGISNILTMIFSAALFFTVYLAVLTIFKEPLTLSIEKQILGKIKRMFS